MARHIGPKNKLARRIGEDLGLKSNPLKVSRRLMVKPGQHGHKGSRKLSGFGTQLKEKQKMKYIYGIMEKQLRKLFEKASSDKTATGSGLLSLLERRLDNAVYRLGFATTRSGARQLVSHGHVRINNKKMNVASYRLQVNDVISLTERGMKVPAVADLLKEEHDLPGWLVRKNAVGHVSRLPERSDISEVIEEQLVVEYYSR